MRVRSHPIRVLLAKPGLDGHDRGIKVVLRALRDHGMEVIWLGLRATPRAIARAALQEDVDAIGVSSLSGAHRTLFPRIAEELENVGADTARIVLFAGGTIPPADHDALRAAGYRAIFGPGTPLSQIVEFLEAEVES